MTVLRWDYRTALIELEDGVLAHGRAAQSMVSGALDALRRTSPEEARQILLLDDDIDVGTHRAEAKIVEMLTLQAPVAEEMRLVLSLQKVLGSVARIGDHCVNVARLGAELAGIEGAEPQLADQMHELGRRAERAVRTGLDCFSQRRTDGVERVEQVEGQVDLLHEGLTTRLIEHAGRGSAQTQWAVRMVLASRELERVGDHAVTIAEEGAFITTGVRRRPRALREL